MAACSRSATEYQDRTRRWRVEDSTYDEYLAWRAQTGAWHIPLTVWIPDIRAPGVAFAALSTLAPRTRQPDDGPVASVDIDPAAVGGAIRARAIRGAGGDSCCSGGRTTVLCENGEYAQLARLHTVDASTPLVFPDLRASYPAVAASAGVPLVFNGQPLFDPLHALGALVDKSGVFVLWADADETPRGWEKVASLPAATEQPRFAVRGHALMAISATPTYFPGFATVSAAEAFAHEVAPAVMSASLGFSL